MSIYKIDYKTYDVLTGVLQQLNFSSTQIQLFVTILKISHLWMISNSINFAIGGLENLTLQPTHRLELARLYSIPQWIAPAICKIILLSLVNITDTEAAQMGFKVYTIIARAKEVIEQEHRALAAYPPSLLIAPSFSCSVCSHSRCKEAWSGSWWKKVAHAILHPMNPLPLTQVLQLIVEAPLPVWNFGFKLEFSHS
jgi:hypothetical protein